jgi:hypothetical protein
MRHLSQSSRKGQPKFFPWLLIEEEKNVVKDIARNITFPTSFVGNFKNIVMKKGDYGKE